jgi:hypothetical protein
MQDCERTRAPVHVSFPNDDSRENFVNLELVIRLTDMCSKPGQDQQTLCGAQSAVIQGTIDRPADETVRDMLRGAWRVLSSTTNRPSRFRTPSPFVRYRNRRCSKKDFQYMTWPIAMVTTNNDSRIVQPMTRSLICSDIFICSASRKCMYEK